MSKEKSTTELRDEQTQLTVRGKEIVALAKTESRGLRPDEVTELERNQLRQQEINIELAELRALDIRKSEAQPTNKFSLRKAMLELADGGNYSEESRKMIAMGEASFNGSGVSKRNGRSLLIPVEQRAEITATGVAGTGSDLIDTQFMDILKPLRDRLVLAQAGATVIPGLVGNIDIPSYSGSSAAWAGENDAAADGAGVFSHKTMKPKRLTSKIYVSRQLLIQDSLAVENLLRADLLNAIASKLEATILGGAAHVDEAPDGLFTGFAGEAVSMNWDNIVGLETEIDLANALMQNSGYIMHTSIRGKAKTTVKKTGEALGFILDPDGTMNGYKALRTNAMYNVAAADPDPAKYGVIFGNWADLLIGQWGAIDLTIDPYTRAEEAMVKIIVNSYWDAAPRRNASFAKALMS
ncbi:MAG: phage major capsid protein [Bacteroides sp.]|jgi:HK97 family phage major capsid protein|nr:phage major capsid protein [Bacteroides sp.]